MKLLSKIFSLFCLLACFAACEDIPMPYEPQTEDDSNDSTIYYSSASLYNGWTLVKIGDNQPWSQGSSYTQATGYQKWDGADTKSNRAAEGLLVSPAFHTKALKTGKVKISFDNCVGYAQNDAAYADHIKLLISKDAGTSSYNAEEWKELDWKATHVSSDWTLTKDEVQLPDEYVNQENVRIAYWFVTGSADKSVTFELKNFVIEEGVAGEGGDDDPTKPQGSGTKDDPYNITAALAYTSALAADTNSDPIYITGYVTSFKSGEEPGNTFGNATYYLADTPDGTSTFLVYRGMYYGGTKFSSSEELSVGDSVVIYSPVVNFRGDTPETVNGKAQIISINGKTQDGGEDTPPTPAGKSTKDNPYTVAQALTGSGNQYVKGYIVGYVDGKTLSTGATFAAATDVTTNLLMADKADEKTVNKCLPVQLPAGKLREALNLSVSGILGKQLEIYGSLEPYFGAPGLKTPEWAKLDGEEIGETPDAITSGIVWDFTKSQCNFTIDNKAKPEALSYIWQQTTQYGMKATAYVNNTDYACEGWLISPATDLTGKTTMSISHAGKFFASENQMKKDITIWASQNGGDWKQLTISTYPSNNDWTFVDATVALGEFAGKSNVKIAFVFKSEQKSGTWEVKKATIY